MWETYVIQRKNGRKVNDGFEWLCRNQLSVKEENRQVSRSNFRFSYFKIENSSIWILSDSRSAIQHLSNWHKMGDNTGVAILEKLKRLLSFREIHQQWVPLYINIAGNEIADALAKDGAA
ncbi:gag-pol [Trichonephila clavipes]|nr:gag-pol [Trichonephila clavipes]